MKQVTALAAIPLAACVGATSLSTSSFRGAGGGRANGQVTIPNVFKLPKEQAIAALRAAGVEGTISDDNSLCGSLVDGRLIERGEVCYQHPPPGRVQGARLPVSLRVQTEDPRHGNVGKITEWRLMPNLVGMSFEQALATMRRAGFEHDDRLQHVWADETTCKPLVVCRQYPDPMVRAGVNDDKVVYVGQDRSAKPAVTTTEPARPTIKPETDTPSTTRPERPQQPTGTGERKHWGGDGSPAYRDSANRPHGPGGPLYMGKGELCTDKLDHCLRPGVWFAVDNVVPGKLFRGTPVFELDGKWWTWRGEPAEYKFLFRTRVADNIVDLEVGKPIVWFVEESPTRKWLDNEHDVHTSSRWSVGVIESLEGSTIRVRGWGTVSLESVRIIVEEKPAPGQPTSTPTTPSPGDLF